MGSKFDEAKGRMKEAAGDVADDDEMRREGRADQAGADVKDKIESAKDKASDLVDKVKDKMTDR